MSATQPRDSRCPQCSTEAIAFDGTYGFYSCSDCQHVWAYAEDDPDLDEAEGYSEVMQQICEVDPGYWAELVEGRNA
jgi:ribosomal protein L37AE/L43A